MIRDLALADLDRNANESKPAYFHLSFKLCLDTPERNRQPQQPQQKQQRL